MYHVHGVCGNCGGRVVTPDVWMGIFPPVPTCMSCGATVRGHEKVLPMNPRRNTKGWGDWSDKVDLLYRKPRCVEDIEEWFTHV